MTNMRPSKSTLLKVVILGDGGVGKTSLVTRLVSNRFDDKIMHTIGVEFMNKDLVIDGEKFTLQIWDTAGQERFRALRTPFYRGTDICLLAYAINEKNSLKSLNSWHDEFLKYADIKTEQFPFIVVGNKNDVDTSERLVSTEEVAMWCQENHIPSFIETSAKNASNINEAFTLAVRQWKKMERSAEIEMRKSEDTVSLGRRISLNQNRGCCASIPNLSGDRSATNSPVRNADRFN